MKGLKTKWTDDEKEAIFKHFGNPEKLPQLPSLQECKRAITKYDVLKRRTSEKIKTWIDNQRRHSKRRQAYQSKRKLPESFNLGLN